MKHTYKDRTIPFFTGLRSLKGSGPEESGPEDHPEATRGAASRPRPPPRPDSAAMLLSVGPETCMTRNDVINSLR